MIDFKLYQNVLSDELINKLENYTKEKPLRQGRVGDRINLKQKNRYDCYITNQKLLEEVDTTIYNHTFVDIKNNFQKEIKFSPPPGTHASRFSAPPLPTINPPDLET